MLIMLALMSGCKGVFREISNDDLHDTNCEVAISLEYKNFDVSQSPAKLYIAFFDRTTRFGEYYEESLDIFYESLMPILSPNDRVILAWMDFNNLYAPDARNPIDSIFFDEIVRSVAPPMFPTPVNTPILMPTLTPGPGSTGKNISIATSIWIQEQNKTPEAVYHCEIGRSNNSAEEIYTNWKSEQEENKHKFLESLREKIEDIKTLPLVSAKYVYESFSLASELIAEEKANNNYSEYVLVFFSDMSEWRTGDNTPSSYDQKKLNGSRILIVMPNCAYTSIQEECDIAQKRWEIEFGELNPTPVFMTNFKSKPTQLSDFVISLSKP